MPKQNRVTPSGKIGAVPERGTMMGNRGRLHDAKGRIRRPWQVKRWLICPLEFNGRHPTSITERISYRAYVLIQQCLLFSAQRQENWRFRGLVRLATGPGAGGLRAGLRSGLGTAT